MKLPLWCAALSAAAWLVLALPLEAATTTTITTLSSSVAFVDLGAGPLYLSATSSPVVYQIADSQPVDSSGGYIAVQGDGPILVSATAHVWARASSPGAKVAVSAGTGISSGGTVSLSGAVSLSGTAGTPTQTSVSVTTGSTTVLAAATATSFVKLCVALSAANGVWVNWAGAAAVQAAPSEYIPPGQCDSWVKSTGYLPTSQINAIAAATVAVTLTYN